MKKIKDRIYRMVASMHIRWIIMTWEFQELVNEFVDDMKKITNVNK